VAGHGVADDAMYQYIEQEWMLPEEYDHLIEDPTDFMLRVYVPRTVGAFAASPPSSSSASSSCRSFSGYVETWGTLASWPACEKIIALHADDRVEPSHVARLRATHGHGASQRVRRMSKARSTSCRIPYAHKGSWLDISAARTRSSPPARRLCQSSDMGLGRTGECLCPPSFRSQGRRRFHERRAFKTFYWPTLRKVLLQVIDAGGASHLFAEGRYGSRLEAIMDLPKAGRCGTSTRPTWLERKNDRHDLALRAKHPASLFHAGTADEVSAYVRKLIDTAGAGGGYIVNLGAGADKGQDRDLALHRHVQGVRRV